MRAFTCLLALSLLAACSGGGSPSFYEGCHEGGLWRGTDPATGFALVGLSSEQGVRVHVVRADGVHMFGQFRTLDSKTCMLVVDTKVALKPGATLVDGSVAGSFYTTGSMRSREYVSANGTIQTSGGSTMPFGLSLAYDDLHRSGSSAGAVVGQYAPQGSAGAEVVTVDSTGRVSSQNAVTQCVLEGQVKPIDQTFDLYDVALRYQNCVGASASLNGLSFSGLGFYDGRTAPAQLYLSTSAAGTSQNYSAVLRLDRM
jgi:hypothetical protein